uniref:Uncharacterized protein n=1 Tax=Ralstonia solanacearum TaxID=305 RepID=A0A0S4VNB0_RALSL|nr:protein of unknown function [Ralstonia solanacearum]CUV36076.1 protein of unknown function [Ralstonia solanacearum]CUV38843.1 protein of unknown function [Ralstonia solanacearum]CUV63892.1 protein of unknown function [Ralstonia solanacearum]
MTLPRLGGRQLRSHRRPLRHDSREATTEQCWIDDGNLRSSQFSGMPLRQQEERRMTVASRDHAGEPKHYGNATHPERHIPN